MADREITFKQWVIYSGMFVLLVVNLGTLSAGFISFGQLKEVTLSNQRAIERLEREGSTGLRAHVDMDSQRVDALKVRIENIEGDAKLLREKLDSINTRLGNIDASLQYLRGRVEAGKAIGTGKEF